MNEIEQITTSLREIFPGNPNSKILTITKVCSLWAGFGTIYEVTCTTNEEPLIFKAIQLPNSCTSIGDLRKKQSYVCEANFYKNGIAQRLNQIGCVVPEPMYSTQESPILIAMTKLNGVSCGNLDFGHAVACMKWFANLHSEFWGKARADEAVRKYGIQQQGTYWYLDTRPDEFNSMPNTGWEGRLKKAATDIDSYLKTDDCFPTVVHGDAKSANMLFVRKEVMTEEGQKQQQKEQDIIVQMYDFQYCGKSSCCKDLAYFFTVASSRNENENALMEVYHNALKLHLKEKWNEQCPSIEQLNAVLDICIADLGRWMSGWGWWGHDIQSRIVKVLDERNFCM